MVEEFVGSRTYTQITNYAIKEYGTLEFQNHYNNANELPTRSLENIHQTEPIISYNDNQKPLPW
jgi:hypothetical protein